MSTSYCSHVCCRISNQSEGLSENGKSGGEETCTKPERSSFAVIAVRRTSRLFRLSVLVAAALLIGQFWTSGQVSAQSVSHRDLTKYTSENGQVQPIRTADDWAVRRRAILDGMQQAMGPLPSFEGLPEFDIKVTEDTRIQDVRRLTLTIQVEAGDRLPLDLYVPAILADKVDPASILTLNHEVKLPAVVALHPTGALGKRIVAGEGAKSNRQYGLELARRGYVTICPDYPSFGQYDKYDFVADRYVSGTMKGIFNHMRCVDLVTAMPCVDGARIATIGHSLGGHNAMFLGVFDPRVQVIVSSCGWTPFHEYYQGKIAGWTSDRYMPRLRDQYQLNPDLVPFDFYEIVAALAPRTFVSISPVHDSNFEVEGVRKAVPQAAKIYTLLNAKNELILVTPDCEHDFPADMREKAYQEIDRVLQHKPLSTPEPDYSGELPRIAPHEPKQALETFSTAPGFEMQLVASEPLVYDPVAMAFDADGRLFVIEMRDYSEEADDRLGRVRLLLDKDQDGTYDESHVFAEGLSWPTAVTCFDGGIFVGAPPHIYYMKDEDGDHKAEKQEVVFTGFGRSNVQGLMNCLHWGPDNRIYGQTSSSGATVTCTRHPDRPAVELRQRDFSFNPRTLELRPESGGAQHGMCFDDYGNRFVCSNSDHAQAIVYNDRYLTRSPLVPAAAPRISIAVDGGQAPVFRTSAVEPWRIVRTRLRASGVVKGLVEGGGRPAGYFTGSTGINVYRGDAWPESLKGLLVMADVGSNIVHRKKAVADGVAWKAHRIDEASELIASNDIWFRPVQSANAPDGCLYILDMYREVIEHPASLPPEIKQHLDLTSGRDRGRLYRLAPTDWKRRDFTPLSKLATPELVAVLAHTNGWHRDTAARLLYERQDADALEGLRRLLKDGETPVSRIHAINVIDGLGSLTADDVLLAIHDGHARVREHGARLAEKFATESRIFDGVSSLVDDDDARVRMQTAYTLGSFPAEQRRPSLLKLAASDAGDTWIRTAILISMQDDTLVSLQSLLSDAGPADSPAVRATILALAELIPRQQGAPSFESLAGLIGGLATNPSLQLELVQRVFRGSAAARNDAAFKQLTASMISDARARAENAELALPQRVSGIRALSLSAGAEESERLFSMLVPTAPPEIQMAAMDTLGSFSDMEIAKRMIDGFADLSPKVMERARELLLNRSDWTVELLTAVADGRVGPNTIPAAELQRLVGHPDATIREKSAPLMKALQTSSRDDIIKKYQPAMSLVGDSERGAAIFKQHCSVCHQLNGVGHAVGPNLATVTNRGAESILVNLLDPNREVNPAWRDYIAVTLAGTTHNGVIITESSTSITLRRAEAKEDTLLRADVETIRDTGRSLMPEGLEKQIDVQGMADLISWLLEQK